MSRLAASPLPDIANFQGRKTFAAIMGQTGERVKTRYFWRSRPGLPRLADAVVEICAHKHKADAGSGQGGRQNGRRADRRHRPLGLWRRQGIIEISQSFLDRNGENSDSERFIVLCDCFYAHVRVAGQEKTTIYEARKQSV